MPDPATGTALVGLLDAASKLGTLAFLLLGLWLIINRRLRTSGEMDDALARERADRERERVDAAARLEEMRSDRNAWRSIAETFGAKMDRQTDVIETLIGKRIS